VTSSEGELPCPLVRGRACRSAQRDGVLGEFQILSNSSQIQPETSTFELQSTTLSPFERDAQRHLMPRSACDRARDNALASAMTRGSGGDRPRPESISAAARPMLRARDTRCSSTGFEELHLQVGGRPGKRAVQTLPPDRPNQAHHKRMRARRVRHRLDFFEPSGFSVGISRGPRSENRSRS
jgi:hypothetical protein